MQKSGKTKYQLFLIANLKKELKTALELDSQKIATEIEKIGFSCQQCGKCCKRAFGDNRVAVIPMEIEKIRTYTGLSKLEVAGPLIPELFNSFEASPLLKETEENSEKSTDISDSDLFEHPEEILDSQGNIHAFGWMLRKKRNGDCIFLEESTKKCRVYPARPMLCRTYPFYLENLKLYISECEGLGYLISKEESQKLAKALLFRYISELEDTLGMYEKFENFENENKDSKFNRRNATNSGNAKNSKNSENTKHSENTKYSEKSGRTYIVHDSSGSVKIFE